MVLNPGLTPNQRLRRTQHMIQYEKAVDWFNMMMSAQLDVQMDNEEMTWTVTDGRRVASITFALNEAQGNRMGEEDAVS